MFPGWFFGLIWRGKITSLDYWGAGISYWLDERPGTLIWAIPAAFVALLAAFIYRRFFLALVDRSHSCLPVLSL
jgi:hypothetical protein